MEYVLVSAVTAFATGQTYAPVFYYLTTSMLQQRNRKLARVTLHLSLASGISNGVGNRQ